MSCAEPNEVVDLRTDNLNIFSIVDFQDNIVFYFN